MPALLTSSLTAGCRALTVAATRSTALRSETSQTSYSPPTSAASSCRRSSRRASSTQCQPRAASFRARAAPIPDEPPVTTATGPIALLVPAGVADLHVEVGAGLGAARVGDGGGQDVAAVCRARRLPGRRVQSGDAALHHRYLPRPVEEAHV